MGDTKTISIALPPGLPAMVEPIAQSEHRTIGELFEDALRRYIGADPDWDALFVRTRAIGKSLGIESKADVERLSDEFRADRLSALNG